MKIETPQILFHADEKGKAAALTGIDLLESGVSLVNTGKHNNSSSSSKVSATHVLATAANANDIHLWQVEFDSMNSIANAANANAALEKNSNNTNSNSNNSNNATKIDFLCALSRHDGPVAALKFSPDGLHLASAGETGALLIYSVPPSKRANANGRHFWSTVRQEAQLQVKVALRCGDGVTDLSWSADSKRLMVGTVDHTVLILEDVSYDANHSSSHNNNNNETESPQQQLLLLPSEWRPVFRNASNHSHFVQGVAYDPSNTYLASMSSDRTIRVLQRKLPPKSKKKLVLRSSNNSTAIPPHAEATAQLLTETKLELAVKAKQIKFRKVETTAETKDDSDDGGAETAATTTTTTTTVVNSSNHHYFADESTLNSFFRRLAWTVDGAYLIAPAALWSASNFDNSNNNNSYATLLFQRHRFDEPCRVLAGLEKVRFAYDVRV